ncbi:MAG: nucleotidyltransferase family protein [Proteobacteria bacterium]|nr:nucleotidyltransferase family protein [Pseudomonadota bacterium]
MPENALYAIVLAAGRASRFGSTKQLAICSGQPLVASAVRQAEQVCGSRSVLVTGNDWRNVAAACEPLKGFFLMNPGFEGGMATSLSAGIRSVQDIANGVLIMLADQPLITVAHLWSLVGTWSGNHHAICASAFAETAGPPVIFPRRYFPELAKLEGDRGAKAVLDLYRDEVITIQFDDAAVDIDRPDDLVGIQTTGSIKGL